MGKRQPQHPQRLYAVFKPPPNERVQIEMFLEAVEDYVSLQSTFPLPELQIQYQGPISDALYWSVVLHASLLRKFFSNGENVELHAVLNALRSKLTQGEERVATNLEEVEKFVNATSVPSRFADGPLGGSQSAWERVLIDLYGRHLHSDFGKWHASKRFINRSNTVPIYEWCRAAARVIDTLVVVIRDGEATGVIDLTDDNESYFTQDGQLNTS